MRIFTIITMLLSASAYADEQPSLNSVPLFSSMVDSKYKGAASKAQEAFLIQSGIDQEFNVVASATTKAVANKVNSKDAMFIAGASYALLVKKQVVQKFRNPMFPAVTHVVTVGKGNGSFGLALPF